MHAPKVTDEWLCLVAQTKGELATAMQLAVDLRGTPTRWLASNEGVMLVSQVSQRVEHMTNQFMSEPAHNELTDLIWKRLSLAEAEDPKIDVNIPRYPDMGGIGGWSRLQLFMWQASVVCTVWVGQERPQTVSSLEAARS